MLSSDTVLTAAHCKTSVSNFQVVVGEHDVTRSDGEQRIRPSAWIQHENYNSRTTNYDFAIVKLASPVAFSDRVNPICLPSSTKNYDSVLATVSGWGTLYSGGSQPSILQKVDTIELLLNNYSVFYLTASGQCSHHVQWPVHDQHRLWQG